MNLCRAAACSERSEREPGFAGAARPLMTGVFSDAAHTNALRLLAATTPAVRSSLHSHRET